MLELSVHPHALTILKSKTKAKQKQKQKSLSFLMWSDAYDNFQIIYIEAHPTRELLTYRNNIIDIVKQAGDYVPYVCPLP